MTLKRILPPLIFLLATVGVYAADNDEFVIGQLAYRVLSEENHEVVVYTDDKSIHGEIEIPAEVTYNSVSYTVTTIATFGFYECTGITKVRIPASIKEIGPNPFLKCSSLTEILVDEDNTVFYTVDGVLFNGQDDMLVVFPGSWGGEYYVPEGVQLIGQSAFNQCTNLLSIHIPESVRNIIWCSFRGLYKS